MAITYNAPTTIYGPNLIPVLTEIFFSNQTLEKGYVTFNDNIKNGSIITTASVTTTAQAYTGAALSASGDFVLTDRTAILSKLEYKAEFLNETIRATRFSETMKKGVWEIESNEFNTKVLSLYAPKMSADSERIYWGGITAATKVLIAALTPGAGQGSITAAAQTAVGTITAGLVDGIFAKAFYDNGAIGAYTKVTGTTVTAANIADEMAKIFAAISPERMQDPNDPVICYCPRAWKQLVYNANNAKGAAQQINFVIEGGNFSDSKVYYNGLEMVFVPAPLDTIAYANNKSRVMWNCDSMDDVNRIEIGKKVADGDTMFIRGIYTIHAHIADAAKGILYGG